MAKGVSAAGGEPLIPASILARVPGCEQGTRPLAIAQLPGGTVNTSFRVHTRRGGFVVRLNGVAGAILGANHAREEQLQAAAAAAGVAPALLYVDAKHAFTITEFISGRIWGAARFAQPDSLRRLGKRLCALHDIIPPAVAPFDLAAILRAHCARLAAALPPERPLFARLLEQSEAMLARCASEQRESVIVHNDLQHSNLIEGDRLYLIDWEYAAVADPIFDVACVLAYYPRARPHAQELLCAAGLGGQASPAALTAATWLFVLLSFLWYRMRRLTRAVPAADLAAEGALLRRLAPSGAGIRSATSAD